MTSATPAVEVLAFSSLPPAPLDALPFASWSCMPAVEVHENCSSAMIDSAVLTKWEIDSFDAF